MGETNKIAETISRISLDKASSILSALKKMDKLNLKLLIVTDNKVFFSLISIGDIQRAIIKGKFLETPIHEILRDEITICNEEDNLEEIKNKMISYRTEFMPILNDKGEVINVIFWKDIFSDRNFVESSKLNLPVVIMAGGKGSRLKPLTNMIPKPLVQLGEKPIIELIIESFLKIGTEKFYFLVNYKSNMIEKYFENVKVKNYKIEYITENEPLGTAGSLYLLKGKIKSTFFVSNCDIIIDQDFTEVYNFHIENKNELTLIGALKHYSIPYGTLETENGGILKELKEKPELTFVINSGVYILEPHLLEEIPEKQFFHITNLIENIKSRNGKIGVFPVSEMSWLDIGNWKEFNRTQEIFLRKQFS